MINWLRRFFKGQEAAPLTSAAAAAAAPAPIEDAVSELQPVDLPLLFFRTLAGASDEAPPASAQLILDELARLVASPQQGADLVPRVPAVIPQLLKSLRDEAVSGADLARQLAQDVVLVAEVIREANSPYFSPPSPIRTIEGAVMLLGQNGMRMLLARVAFRPIISMQTGRFAHQGAPLVWRESEACALAASLLAPARQLSANIATIWDFPPSVAAAIEQAGTPIPESPLARVLAGAERLAMLRLLVDGGQLAAPQAAVPASEQTVFAQLSAQLQATGA